MAKLLLVEDEANLRELVGARLEQAGYEVVFAVDGYDAVNKARHETPDLVILDLMIPKMDGYTVCRLLRFGGFPDMPIIMFTARSMPEDQRRGLDMGATAYVTKPFEPQVLLSKIEELLSLRKGESASSEPAPETEQNPGA